MNASKSSALLVGALVVACSATALAGETATDLRTAILACKPSCYERVSFNGAKKIKVCAYLPTHFTQEKRGRSWGPLERSSAMSPIPVASCKFPTAVPGKWKALVAQARKQLDLEKGDVVTIAAGEDWGLEKDDLGRVTARDIIVNHYSKGHEDYDRCHCGNPWAVCEGTNNEVTSFNQAHYRVTEAKKLLADGNAKECRVAAWEAVRQAVDTRHERESHADNWQSLTYATRYDGVLSEKAMFARTEELEAEARELWTSCGGKGEVPPNK